MEDVKAIDIMNYPMNCQPYDFNAWDEWLQMAKTTKAMVATSTVVASLAVILRRPMATPETSKTIMTASLVGAALPPQIPPKMAKRTPTTKATFPIVSRRFAIFALPPSTLFLSLA